jgi:hypothetical protein
MLGEDSTSILEDVLQFDKARLAELIDAGVIHQYQATV